MEKLLELLKKIDFNFCASHRRILIYRLTNDKAINFGVLVSEITECKDCKEFNKEELLKLKNEFTPFRIGSLLSYFLSQKIPKL